MQPDLRDLDAVPGGWSGIGWFRYRVMLDPAVQPSTIGVLTKQTGACELYVDCQLAVRFGTVSADPESERAVAPQRLGAVTLRHLTFNVQMTCLLAMVLSALLLER